MSDPFKTMRINAPKGQKVLFTAIGGAESEVLAAKETLKIGDIYTVEKTEVFSPRSLVMLKELPNEGFNTVMFEETGELLEPQHTSEELYRMGVKERTPKVT